MQEWSPGLALGVLSACRTRSEYLKDLHHQDCCPGRQPRAYLADSLVRRRRLWLRGGKEGLSFSLSFS